ncbi:hypothetical protein KTD31_01030 [Burkholderia multivorans]|jgi:hypothetical protein|uniref:hypothetical protein n=1 Tax=Burkholderia multivorans TaxID=87883 RepID=UPI001C23821D|nr:hypothetical protein [Burkholderia multivorans]MBU9199985.1 hypothetical protein [Burkholderia multivorans]MDN8078896.1 hypothetical protein [Burkholderia multivorans]
MATGLLIVDVQPQYDAFCGLIAAQVARRINNTVKPVSIMWVGEGLSNDSEETVREYLCEHGARPGRLAQAHFIEKGYGFFRGWMDNAVASDDIVKVGKDMLQRGLYSSEDVDLERLYAGDVPELPELDLLHRPSFDDGKLRMMDRFETCGGGSAECLAEIELWLQMVDKPFCRLDSMVY